MSIENGKENYKNETDVFRKYFKDSKTVFVFILAILSVKLRQFYSFSSEDVDLSREAILCFFFLNAVFPKEMPLACFIYSTFPT